MQQLIRAGILGTGILVSSFCQAQGLIVNEASNGTSGAREYMEFLVIGSAAAPSAPVDLRGWIIDDNNGSFETGVGTGVAQGHFRIAPSCAALAAVPVGAIILVYNADEFDGAPANDLTDANSDKVYVLPHTSACLEVCTTAPTTANPNYTGCAYQSTTTLAVNSGRSWSAVALGNTGDAVQTRRPNGTFFHGFAYGGISNPFPTFSAELGGGNSFNVATGSGAARSFGFGCGAWNVGANYGFVPAGSQTPAAPNNTNNAALVSNLRNGSFDYANPANPNNCLILLAVRLLDFEAQAMDYQNRVYFNTQSDKGILEVLVEKSQNGVDFFPIGSFSPALALSDYQNEWIDAQPYPTTYYRLKITERDGAVVYSGIQSVKNTQHTSDFVVYPNPAQDLLNVRFGAPLSQDTRIALFNNIGQLVYEHTALAGEIALQISLQNLPAAAYTVRLLSNEAGIHQLFIKQ
jgi:hypothetical protein